MDRISYPMVIGRAPAASVSRTSFLYISDALSFKPVRHSHFLILGGKTSSLLWAPRFMFGAPSTVPI